MATILLDSGLVGLAISPARGKEPERDADGSAFRRWVGSTTGIVHQFAIADVTRFEVQRELLRLEAWQKFERLNALLGMMLSVDVYPADWDRASVMWALVRQAGRPTASPDSLDGDAILAAVAAALAEEGERVIVATTNVGHLKVLGADARAWRDIADTD